MVRTVVSTHSRQGYRATAAVCRTWVMRPPKVFSKATLLQFPNIWFTLRIWARNCNGFLTGRTISWDSRVVLWGNGATPTQLESRAAPGRCQFGRSCGSGRIAGWPLWIRTSRYCRMLSGFWENDGVVRQCAGFPVPSSRSNFMWYHRMMAR